MMAGYASDGTPIYRKIHPSTSTSTSSPVSPPSYQTHIHAPTHTHTHTAAASGTSAAGNDPTIPTPPKYGDLNMNMNMNMGMKVGEPMNKGRGRPRKYVPDGIMSLGASSRLSNSASGHVSQSTGASDFNSPMDSANPVNSPSGSAFGKKGRGRPPGSSGKQKQKPNLASSPGSSRNEFHPHVVTVKAGEDVSSKIMSYLKDGPHAVCIISANGIISNVTIRRAAMSSGTVTYEGRFEILTLSGSFLLSGSDAGHRSRTGGLSISLLNAQGHVLGGGVAGILTAASPVQVVMGGFNINERNKSKKPMSSNTDINRISPIPVAALRGPTSPNSRAASSEPSGSLASPFDNAPQQGIFSPSFHVLPTFLLSVPRSALSLFFGY